MFGKIIAAVFAASTLLPLAAANAAPVYTAPATHSGIVLDAQYGGGKYSERHYRWCEQKYKSYQRSTNSYWNYYGQQKQCRSPYM